MTGLMKFLIENLPNSKFKFDDFSKHANLEVGEMLMFWTNFAGEANQFGNDARNFNLAISEELKDILEKSGKKVRIHELGGKKDEETGEVDPIIYYINVKVKMDGAFPPVIKLYTDYRGERSCTELSEDTVACLDHAKIITADCNIRISESTKNPGHFVCYLKRLYAIQEKRVEFDGKYDDWMNESPDESDQN